jgi:sulfite reductase alpha subunit-like flavoprotein
VIESVDWIDGTTSPAPLPHLHRGHTIQHNLLWALDLTLPPSKAMLIALAACTSDPTQAATLLYLGSRDGRAAYKADIAEGRPTLVQLLKRYDACKPPIERLLELLSPLRPRQYSLANAQHDVKHVLECAYHVVVYDTHWGAHSGVATTWLEREGCRQSNGSEVSLFVSVTVAHMTVGSVFSTTIMSMLVGHCTSWLA